MRFIEIPALITEDIEDPSIVDITEPISASISGTTMTIDGGSKVSGEATITLTGETTVNAFTLQNIRTPSIHKISVKTNKKGNFTYVPNDDVTASSLSTTTKTGSDFEILLISTTGGETYVDFDMADYVSPAVYTSNALTGFDISEVTSTYGATAKLYKPNGDLLTTVSSATSGGSIGFGSGVEQDPQDVTYTLEVTDDLGRTSRYDLPRKWISYAMNETPGFQKLALAGNEYTTTVTIPNLTSSSKAKMFRTDNHGYLGINFKIQGRNSTGDDWVDIDSTGENDEFQAFGDYLYHRVWVKPTAKATTTVTSSNVVTLTLSNLTETNVTTSFVGLDPYDINESTNTYVFEETTKIGTVPFTVTLDTETYTNAFTATTVGTAYDYVTLAFANPTLSLTTSNVTISSAKLYKDDVLFHTYGTESNVVLRSDQTGTYQAIVNDVYYSNRVTPDFTTTRSSSAPQLEFDGYNKLSLNNITPTSSTLGVPDGTTHSLTTQTNVYIYETGTYTANVQSSDTFAYLSNVVSNFESRPTRLQGSDISAMGTTNYTRYGVPSTQSIDVEDFLFNSSSNINPCIDFIHLANSQDTFVFDLESAKTINKIRIYAGNTTPNWASRNTGSVIKLYNGTTLVYTSPSLTFSRSSPENYYGPYEEGKDYNTLLFTTGYANIDKITVETPSTSAALGRVEVNDFTDLPSFTFDGYNKLTLENITQTSSTLEYGSNTYDTNTASNVYVTDAGEYKLEARDANTFVMSNVYVGALDTQVDYTNLTSMYYGGAVTDVNGVLYTWGHDGYGDSGRGASDRIPTAITSISDPVSNVWRGTPGYTVAAKTSTDKWYMWGRNTYSAVLGNTTNTGNVTTPEDVTAKVTEYFGDQTVSANKIIKMAMGEHHAAALTAGGKVWSWGNDFGYYSTGTGTNNSTVLVTPVLLTTDGSTQLTGITEIQATYRGMSALDSSGNVWFWGGSNTSMQYAYPTKILDSTSVSGIVGLRATNAGTLFAWKSDGTFYTRGRGSHGQLANGSEADQYASWQTVTTLQGKTIKKVFGGNENMFVWTNDGVYGVGRGNNYKLGNGSTSNRSTFHKSNTISALSIREIDFGHATGLVLTTDGRGYMWGEDASNSMANALSGHQSGAAEATSISALSFSLPLLPTLTFDGYNKLTIENVDSIETATIKKDDVAFATTTSNTVYIRDTGTYTAEVKGSGAYAIELSKEVTGSITSELEWKSNENQIVYASDAATSGGFGFGGFVSVDGNYAIIGAEGNNAAYIFYKSGGTWSKQAILTGNDTGSSDEFGTCVAIKGDYAVVAARGHNSYAGAAYVFVRSGTNWTQQQKLTASDAASNDKLATCSIDGDYIILGAWGDDTETGAVYIFKRSGTSWSQQDKITASNAGHVDQFGSSISLSGDYAVISAWSEDTAGTNAGSAYIFKRGAGTETWTQQAIIRGDTIDADDRLGDVKTSASISGDYAIVGSHFQDTGGSNRGSVYIFKKDTGAETWTQQAQLQPSDIADEDHFGYSVSINGSIVVVGAYQDDSPNNSGSAYIFERSGTTWTEVKKIVASDAEENDQFGSSVTTDGTTIFVGAAGEDTKGNAAGAAYVYEKGPAGPYATYDNYNKITIENTNYADTTNVTYYSNTYELVTAKTMYVKDVGEYVFKISGTDKYVESNVYVSSVDLAGASTKPIDFDGYNKLTLIDAGSNVSANVTYFSNTYELGSANVLYINGAGTYGLEMSGSNVFALSSNVVGGITSELVWKSNEDQILYGSDPGAEDNFGHGIAVEGNYAVVGARYNDTGGTDRGAAFIYYKSDGTWTEQAMIQPSDTSDSDWFGRGAAISGDYIIVNAYAKTTNNTGQGAAYIFYRSGTSWTQQAKLLSSDIEAGDAFSYSVDIDGDYAIVGALNENPGGTTQAGSAYIFYRSGTSWAQQAKIQASDKEASDNFGRNVSISGDYVAVAASQEDTGGTDAGAVYIFKRSGTSWTQQQKIQASDKAAGDEFGSKAGQGVSLSGDTLAVGAYLKDTSGLTDVGAVYIFKKASGTETWSQEAKLQASDVSSNAEFGASVSLSGNVLAVGASDENTNATDSGAAYVFERSGTTWTEVKKITASDAGASDFFGESISTDGTTIFVGAFNKNTKGTGAGAAYIFSKGPKAVPTLNFDGYNKLTIENFTTSESDTRTAKLTDPNDVEYTLGQTQNDIYIEETGDYTLEVTNSDQSAVVKTNVGTISTLSQGATPSGSHWYNNVLESGLQVTIDLTGYWSSWGIKYMYELTGNGSNGYTDGVLVFRRTTNGSTYNDDGDNRIGFNPSNSDGSRWHDIGGGEPSSVSKNTSTGQVTLNTFGSNTYFYDPHTHNSDGSVGGDPYTLIYYPTLTFDNYNKLSINNLTPTSSRLTYGSNTYEIGTASNVYIEHAGTYKMATGDANTFALVSNVVTGSVGPELTLGENIVSINKFTTTNASELFGHADAKNYAFSKDKSIFVTSSDTADGSTGPGKVFIYKRGSDDTYTLDTTLNAVQGGTRNFGHSLDINDAGTRLVISEPEISWDNGAGRIYVYDRASTSVPWPSTPTTTLNTSTDTGSHKGFGYDLALSGDGNTIGTSTYGGGSYNRAYIFEYSGSSWLETKTWGLSGTTDVGASCDLSHDGTRFVVGSFTSSGTKWYSFHKTGSTWAASATEHTLASASRANIRISGNGNMVLVGMETDSSCEIWEYNSSWSRTTTLTQTTNFGCSMASNYTGTIFAIGESSYNSSQGRVFIYSKSGSTITLLKILVNPDSGSNQWFGMTGGIEIDYYGHILAVNAPGFNSYKGKVELFENPSSPSLTYDTSNKLSITGITPTATTLTDPNGSRLDIGTASNVYIRDSGTYAIASKDANTFVLVSNTVTGTPTGTTYTHAILTGSHTRISDRASSNQNRTHNTGSSDWPDSNSGITHYQDLSNGDRSYQKTSGNDARDAAQLFDGVDSGSWESASHGANGTHSPMTWGYKFNQGAKQCSKMILVQPPSSHHAGNVTIKYWDGTSMTAVSNQNPSSMDNQATDNDPTTFTFDAVSSQFWQIDCYRGSSNSTNYTGLHAWEIYDNPHEYVTGTTPSQTYDNTKTITVSNVPAGTSTVGKIYKGSTAYPIYATTSTSNVIIKNTGTYLSVFTTATQAFLTNAINVNADPTTTNEDNTIEDEGFFSGTIAFHHGTFADSGDPYSDGSVTTAATNGHIFADTVAGEYSWGTLGTPSLTANTNTSYTWTPASEITGADVLMVAGGGGGGGIMGGGGGAGGLVFSEGEKIYGAQTIVVGNGGGGGTFTTGDQSGDTGNDTIFLSYIASGGGAGYSGDSDYPISKGGSGGGYGSGTTDATDGYSTQLSYDGKGFGNPGGSGGGRSGGGGGGAGTAGQDRDDTSSYDAGVAGQGKDYSSTFGTIYGESGWFAGGGGGGGRNDNNAGAPNQPSTGGQGGGGDGTLNSGTNSSTQKGIRHTGGGGGGSGWDGSASGTIGGDGGSGIVLVKFTAIPGVTAVPSETVTDTPSATLDATDTTATEPTLNLDFTTTLPKTLKRYNSITSSSIGARFNRHDSKKKRIEKSISIPSSFSAELTANNASSPTTLTVTVANSKFVINGDETPTLAFIRGETYTFDQSDSSNSGHPLVLATSADGTQYTTGWTASGTPGTDGSHVFTVPYDVPDTIYYKCSNHNNMGGEIHTTFGNAFSLGDFTVAANTHVSGEYTLAVNYDGTTSNLYVDGTLITQTTRTISAGTKDFILGKEFDGYVKNFKFWNKNLVPVEGNIFESKIGSMSSGSWYNEGTTHLAPNIINSVAQISGESWTDGSNVTHTIWGFDLKAGLTGAQQPHAGDGSWITFKPGTTTSNGTWHWGLPSNTAASRSGNTISIYEGSSLRARFTDTNMFVNGLIPTIPFPKAMKYNT